MFDEKVEKLISDYKVSRKTATRFVNICQNMPKRKFSNEYVSWWSDFFRLFDRLICEMMDNKDKTPLSVEYPVISDSEYKKILNYSPHTLYFADTILQKWILENKR